jgi:hypothetical protein
MLLFLYIVSSIACRDRWKLIRTGSAGVGRTGSFIVVDAVVDAIRREMSGPSGEPSGAPSFSASPSQTPEYEGVYEADTRRSNSRQSSSGLNTATSVLDLGGARERHSSDRSHKSDQSIHFLQPLSENASASLPGVFATSPSPTPVSPIEFDRTKIIPKVEAKASKIAQHLAEKKEEKVSMAMDIDPPANRPARPASPTNSNISGNRSIQSGRSGASGASGKSNRSGQSGSSGLSGFASGSASAGSGSVEKMNIPSLQDRNEMFRKYRGSVGGSDSESDARPSMSMYGSEEKLTSDK